jgi:hypothetical protein
MSATRGRGSSSRSSRRGASGESSNSGDRPTRGRSRSQSAKASGSESNSESGGKSTARKSSSGRSSSGRGAAASRSTASRSTSSRGSSGRSSSGRSSAKRSSDNGEGKQAKRSQSQDEAASRNGQPSEENGGRSAIARIGVPAVTGAVGIAGGVLLGRTVVKQQKKVLGIPIRTTKLDLTGVTHQIGEAGKQFGKLAEEVRGVAGEVRTAREKAEQIAKIFG